MTLRTAFCCAGLVIKSLTRAWCALMQIEEHYWSLPTLWLTNEDRWATLKGNEVRERSHFWPSKQLLKFREDALRAATERRHKMQESYSFFCKHCKRSFMQVSALGKHENKCTGRQRTASTYLSPYSKGPSAVEDDEEYL